MKEVGFALRKINTEEFATIDKEIIEENELDVQLNINNGFGINEENRLVACFFHLQFELEKSPIIILKLNCEFEIEENAWKGFIGAKNKLKFKKGFLQHLGVITLGTARGVLHSKTENTPYNKFFLPTINVIDIITKDESFDLEKE
ncbi:hypothetical protein H0I31_00695 [Tenacibaculum sp. AHE15PA]|uniref:hypothetical protein n=1 Tax=unclassified Tenacibaculum TaxID=2635139 RepID=UPI001C4EBAF2|nr:MULTISPECIES: hypothetical protein [unclassified Tenacibaculum]QXP74665.1 hypothetical protein H0I30_05955 [Tenacibaculum sp. AHE14PA]QXP76176.1 hypothetical protein H0I31_00695 [Tenacibaculum sp. AHE15PA]